MKRGQEVTRSIPCAAWSRLVSTGFLSVVAASLLVGCDRSENRGPMRGVRILNQAGPESQDSLVPPVPLNGVDDPAAFEHDTSAIFHAHGTTVCASGCAASRHPTERLSEGRFRELVEQADDLPLTSENHAFETLLYFGPQTRSMLNRCRDEVSSELVDRLESELQKTHARIEIRVIDELGEVRAWLPGTQVPLDRRHVFVMNTHRIQPLVTSGTVKRVGVHHLWTRL